jgi:hypothetical protein
MAANTTEGVQPLTEAQHPYAHFIRGAVGYRVRVVPVGIQEERTWEYVDAAVLGSEHFGSHPG